MREIGMVLRGELRVPVSDAFEGRFGSHAIGGGIMQPMEPVELVAVGEACLPILLVVGPAEGADDVARPLAPFRVSPWIEYPHDPEHLVMDGIVVQIGIREQPVELLPSG